MAARPAPLPSTAGCAATTQPGRARRAGARDTVRPPETAPHERARVPRGQLPAGFLADPPDAAAREAAPAAGSGHCRTGRPGRLAAYPAAAGGGGPALRRGRELQAAAVAAEGDVAVPAGPDRLPAVAAGPRRHVADPRRTARVPL